MLTVLEGCSDPHLGGQRVLLCTHCQTYAPFSKFTPGNQDISQQAKCTALPHPQVLRVTDVQEDHRAFLVVVLGGGTFLQSWKLVVTEDKSSCHPPFSCQLVSVYRLLPMGGF